MGGTDTAEPGTRAYVVLPFERKAVIDLHEFWRRLLACCSGPQGRVTLIAEAASPVAPAAWPAARVVERPPEREALDLPPGAREWTLEPAEPEFWDALAKIGPSELAAGGELFALIENGEGGVAACTIADDFVAMVRGVPDDRLLEHFRLTRYPPPPDIVRLAAEAAALLEARPLDLSESILPKLALVPREPKAKGMFELLQQFLDSPFEVEPIPDSPEVAKRREQQRRDHPRVIAKVIAGVTIAFVPIVVTGLLLDGTASPTSVWLWWSAASIVGGGACLIVAASTLDSVMRSSGVRWRYAVCAGLLPLLPCVTQIALMLLWWDGSMFRGPEIGVPMVTAFGGAMFAIQAWKCMDVDAVERAEAEQYANDGRSRLLEDESEPAPESDDAFWEV